MLPRYKLTVWTNDGDITEHTDVIGLDHVKNWLDWHDETGLIVIKMELEQQGFAMPTEFKYPVAVVF